MKTRIIALLAVLAMLIGCGSMAEGIALTPVLSGMSYIEPVDNTSYLIVSDDSPWLYGIMDTAGNQLTEVRYTFLAGLDYGYFAVADVVEGVNITGIIDANGNQVAENKYISVNVLSPRWGIGAYGVEADESDYVFDVPNADGTTSYYNVDTVDIIDLENRVVAGNLPYDKCYGGEAYHDFLILQDINGACTLYDSTLTPVNYEVGSVYESIYGARDGKVVCLPTGEVIAEGYDYASLQQLNGQDVMYVSAYTEDYESLNGVIDMEGNVIIPLGTMDFYSFDYTQNMIQTYEDGFYGLYDIAAGTQIVPSIYDNIEHSYYSADAYVNNGYICVEKDDMLGFVDTNGNVTCELKYNFGDVSLAGCVLLISNDDDSTTIVMADGTETTVPYTVYSFSACGNGVLLPACNYEDYTYGLIDCYGNVVLDFVYDDVLVTADSRAVIVSGENGYELLSVN